MYNAINIWREFYKCSGPQSYDLSNFWGYNCLCAETSADVDYFAWSAVAL
jgi:hypothetical protein